MTTLPSRIHWVATPEPSSAIVTQVAFLIDGKVTWIENNPPFVFGGDDGGTNLGYLVTTWLHRVPTLLRCVQWPVGARRPLSPLLPWSELRLHHLPRSKGLGHGR